MDIQRSVNADALDASFTILVVDDDQDNLLLITYQLQQLFDCTVMSATDGFTALSLAQSAQPNLILLDIMLPEMDGLEVARRLKQDPRTMAIPIVAVTAMARTLDQDLALQSGCNDYVCKPYDMETLESAIYRNLHLSCLLRA